MIRSWAQSLALGVASTGTPQGYSSDAVLRDGGRARPLWTLDAGLMGTPSVEHRRQR